MSKELLERKDIKKEDTWDIESMYASKEEWEKDYDKVEELLKSIVEHKGEFTKDSESLYNLLKEEENLIRTVSNLYSFSRMNLDVDTTNSSSQELSDRGLSLVVRVQSETSFIEPEILALGRETIEGYMEENEDLKIYGQYFDDLFRLEDHTLSPEMEALMAQVDEVGGSSQKTFSMLNNADLVFPKIKDENGDKVQITHGNFIPFMESEDRQVRKAAYDGLYSVYTQFENTIASTLTGDLKNNMLNAKMRGFDSSRQASLARNNIPESVYDNLIESVEDNLDAMHKYMDIRKRALGVDELHMYDLYTPIVKGVDMKYTYEEGVELIKKALVPLGEEYMEIMTEGFNDRWVDIHENKGKRSGAYSSGTYDSKPFILLNFKETLDNVFTVAHEMGHSMHSYLTKKYQPFVYGSYSIFLAEVASTTNESLLLQYLLDNVTDTEERKYLINHYLESFRGTLFRQTMFAEFEMIINRHLEAGGALTAEYLSQVYKDLNIKYYGPNVVVDDKIAREWARIPHFYMNFYVFQYATGYSAAIDLSDKILNGGEEAVDKYLGFLKAGKSKYPTEILKDAGVDMTTKEPVDNAMKVFRQLVDEFDKLI